MIRSFHPNDISAISRIHEKYYDKEFSLPDFIDKFLCSFTIVDNGEIICSGGVRCILESIAITDKSKSPRIRRAALYELLQASSFVAKRHGYDQIHASIISDNAWKQHLGKVGFKPIKGEMLVLEV